ncbi:MAG: O-antigen ligase family protein, partial [Bacteroidaceae bacterium]|nr:O-antigen ligase family protein [Bacteroidaceae bacterium]
MRIPLQADKVGFIQWPISLLLIVNASVSLTVFPVLQNVSYAVWGLCCVAFLVMLGLFVRNPKITIFEMYMNLYLLLLITFSVVCGNDIKTACYKSIEMWTLLFMFNFFKRDLSTLMKASAIVLSLCVYANLVWMAAYPNWMLVPKGQYEDFMLGGNYNQMGARLILASVVSMVCVGYGKKWLANFILTLIASVFTLLWVGSMTSSACMILFTVLCLIPGAKLKKVALAGFFTFYVLFQVFVCFSGEGLHNNELAVYLIRDVMHKDMTFTHRTHMWDSAAHAFSQSPIWGYGCVDTEWYLSHMSSFAVGPHNFIYSVLLNGGVIL